MANPILIFSSCQDERHTGDSLYNGGVKLQNLWVKLLRQHGHEAYLCTYDGQHADWLIEHQPHVPINQVKTWTRLGHDVRVITTWIVSELVMTAGTSTYFFDAEIAHSMSGAHFEALKWWMPKLAGIATHSRTQQAWYIATFGVCPPLIQEWSDTTYWTSDASKRLPNRIGYMYEGPHTDGHIAVIRKCCERVGVKAEFVLVKGSERQVIDLMRTCDVFLGLNLGKNPLWGEGCPRSQQESVHAGCVLLAYDVNGNREFIIPDYTGYLVPCDSVKMGAKLAYLLTHEGEKERVRWGGLDFVKHQFAPTEAKYQQIKEWLKL